MPRSAKAAGALVVADNTFLSPVWQQPLALGADLVIHSTTKYLNGHSDVVGGAVIAATAELHEQVKWWGNCIGVTGAPFDSFLTLRGLRTLHARMRAHGENAQRIAELLDAARRRWHASTTPGSPRIRATTIAQRQQQGFGAMVSFELVGGVENVKALLGSMELFSLAESLGGVESLVAHPASMTHAAMDAAARERAGISDDAGAAVDRHRRRRRPRARPRRRGSTRRLADRRGRTKRRPALLPAFGGTRAASFPETKTNPTQVLAYS